MHKISDISENTISMTVTRTDSLRKGFQDIRKLLEEAAAYRQETIFVGHHHPLNLENVLSIKKSLKGLIFMGLDKNSGKTVVCAVKMYEILKKTFMDDKNHYKELPRFLDERKIIESWRSL